MNKFPKKVYVLKHNDEVIYVGQTQMSLEKRKNNRYAHIPRDIIKNSVIEEIDTINDQSEMVKERNWIEHYKSKGCKLYNILKGNGFDINQYQKENFKHFYEIYFKQYWKEYKIRNKDKYREYMRNYMKTYKKNKENNG